MPDQKKVDKKYLRVAKVISEESYAKRKKVGCIIVQTNQIIAEGYNGTPSGFDNDCEYKKENHPFIKSDALTTKPEVLHAESNAITKIAKSTNSSDGATLYSTCSPCFDCAKLIIQSGIKRVVYEEDYRNSEGLSLLHKANIQVCKLEKAMQLRMLN